MQQVAEAGLAGTQSVNRGTQTGSRMGIPATGKDSTVSRLNVVRVEDGRIAEDWVVVDTLGLLQQKGVAATLEGQTA